jgi:acetyl esterase/lipase
MRRPSRKLARKPPPTLVLLVSLAAALALAGCGTGGSGGAAASPSAAALAAAAGVPGAKSVLTDLAYAGDSPSQKLDLYLPAAGEAPYPVILAIHGGGFISGDKADGQITPVLEALRRGYAVAGVNYRLSGEATFPAAISDDKAAIRWLRANAGEYQLDPSQVAAWGQSAGGNLAALAGTSGEVPTLRGPHPANAGQSDSLQAVVDWYGPISFLQTDRDFRAAGLEPSGAAGPGSFLSVYLGAPLTEVPGKVKAADPITYITPDDPPVLIEHGAADGIVPYPQSERFAEAMAERAGPDNATLRILPGARHVDPAFFSQEHVDGVLDWLDRQLR